MMIDDDINRRRKAGIHGFSCRLGLLWHSTSYCWIYYPHAIFVIILP